MIVGRVAWFLRVMGFAWIGSGLIAAGLGARDYGLFDGDTDTGAVMEVAGRLVSGLVPGVLIVGLANALRRRLTGRGIHGMTFR